MSATPTPLQTLNFADGEVEGRIVFDAAVVDHPKPAWFDPAFWGTAAQPVTSGGRGGAWFLQGPFGAAVLRHYLRGGQMARVSRDRFVWHGVGQVRSHRELALLAHMRHLQLPVPKPLASIHWRQGLTYRQAILIGRIEGAQTLAALLQAGVGDHSAWRRIGKMLAHFHQARFFHADLNAHNVLLDAAGQPCLIDFDKGKRMRKGDNAWREETLTRFARSVRKVSGRNTALAAECLQSVTRAYEEVMA